MFILTLVLSGILYYLFSYLLDNWKYWNLTLKFTPTISTFYLFLE